MRERERERERIQMGQSICKIESNSKQKEDFIDHRNIQKLLNDLQALLFFITQHKEREKKLTSKAKKTQFNTYYYIKENPKLDSCTFNLTALFL